MFHRAAAVLALAGLLAACGGGATATVTPVEPTAQPPSATDAPAATTPPGGGNTGSFEGVARSLFPPGATQQSSFSTGNAFQLIALSSSSMDELGSFFSQQIPALGLTETGRFESGGTLTIAFTNPDGGILIIPADDEGQYLITISVGTST